MPPEIVDLFRDWPLGILFVFLAAPFFILLGVVITGIIQRIRDRGVQKVAEANINIAAKGVEISELEAQTHQFQIIFDGFSQSLAAVSNRAKHAEEIAANAEAKAEQAEAKAEVAEEKADSLGRRVKSLENERHDAIDHIILLERLIPNPPGPPTRPIWMQRTTE